MATPELPSRENPWGMAKSVGKSVGSGEGLVNYVEFVLTGRCEGGCITCPTIEQYPDEPRTKSIVNLEAESDSFRGMFEKLKGMGLKFATLYGREPSLWDRESTKLTGEHNLFLRNFINWLHDDLDVRVCLAASGLNLDEPLLRTLYETDGVLFMKNWGGENSVGRLMKGNKAFERNKRSWELALKLRSEYDGPRIIGEFLYTGLNRGDLPKFWQYCLSNQVLPFVEVPVIRGACVRNFPELNISREQYVRDIYNLSLVNLCLQYGLSMEEAKNSDVWEPPYGSVFPSPCDKLTRGKGIFLERNGDISICSGVPLKLGNINDEDIEEKLGPGSKIIPVRNAYQNLEGSCNRCYYSQEAEACYGCRGKAYEEGNLGSIVGEDAYCFGVNAKKIGLKQLLEYMSEGHAQKVMKYW